MSIIVVVVVIMFIIFITAFSCIIQVSWPLSGMRRAVLVAFASCARICSEYRQFIPRLLFFFFSGD